MSSMNYYGDPQPKPSTFNSFLSGTTEFMDSNSAISNFAYVILLVVIFVIVMQIGINIIQYIFYPKASENHISNIHILQLQLVFGTSP